MDLGFSGDNICEKTLFTSLSIANKITNITLMNLQNILNFIYAIIIILCLHVYRGSQRRLHEACDGGSINALDFAIKVENLPRPEPNSNFKEEIA